MRDFMCFRYNPSNEKFLESRCIISASVNNYVRLLAHDKINNGEKTRKNLCKSKIFITLLYGREYSKT